jgi:hypothetical protein
MRGKKMNKTYLISFDPDTVDYRALNRVIKSSKYIIDWWHYLRSTYIVVSPYSLKEIHQDIRKRWPDYSYLIIEVNKENCAGFLPERAWEWLKKNFRPSLLD